MLAKVNKLGEGGGIKLYFQKGAEETNWQGGKRVAKDACKVLHLNKN